VLVRNLALAEMREGEQLPSIADEQTRRAQVRVGQLVRGRWHLDSLLGVGGMAAVYGATHRNGKRVALKMLHAEVSTNTEVRQRFVDEGYAANRVGHPGAVSVIDDDVAEDGSAFLVMDLLEGETIETRLHRRGRLWPGEVLPITYALLDVLAAAHDKGIVHRDIKPDNVFVTRDGKVKLLDFGIARLIEPGRPRTTQSGATMGTPAFMPPEQARGRWDLLDGRTDLWAVGATMFIQLTGRQVREAQTPNEELLLAMTVPAPPLAELAPELPKPLIDLVDRALAVDQDDRWPNARAMQAEVRRVQELLGTEGSMPIATMVSSIAPQADSSAPMTLLTPHPIVSSTFPFRLVPWRERKAVLVAGGALATFVVMVFATHPFRNHPTVASQPPPDPPAVQPHVEALQPPSSTPIAIAPQTEPPVVGPSDAPEAQPERATVVRPKMDKPRPIARPAPRPSEARPAPGVSSSQPVAVPAPGQLPSSADPLDRRR